MDKHTPGPWEAKRETDLRTNLENKDSVLQQIIEITREDGGQSEQWEMPF